MSIEIRMSLVYRIRYAISQYDILIPYQFDNIFPAARCTNTKPDPTLGVQSSVDSVQFGSSKWVTPLSRSLSLSLYSRILNLCIKNDSNLLHICLLHLSAFNCLQRQWELRILAILCVAFLYVLLINF